MSHECACNQRQKPDVIGQCYVWQVLCQRVPASVRHTSVSLYLSLDNDILKAQSKVLLVGVKGRTMLKEKSYAVSSLHVDYTLSVYPHAVASVYGVCLTNAQSRHAACLVSVAPDVIVSILHTHAYKLVECVCLHVAASSVVKRQVAGLEGNVGTYRDFYLRRLCHSKLRASLACFRCHVENGRQFLCSEIHDAVDCLVNSNHFQLRVLQCLPVRLLADQRHGNAFHFVLQVRRHSNRQL